MVVEVTRTFPRSWYWHLSATHIDFLEYCFEAGLVNCCSMVEESDTSSEDTITRCDALGNHVKENGRIPVLGYNEIGP